MFIDILALIGIVELGAETVEALETLITLLSGEPEQNYSDLTLEQKTQMLKDCTKIVANLDLDLSCYPLGHTTTILFDLDGNPVP